MRIAGAKTTSQMGQFVVQNCGSGVEFLGGTWVQYRGLKESLARDGSCYRIAEQSIRTRGLEKLFQIVGVHHPFSG